MTELTNRERMESLGMSHHLEPTKKTVGFFKQTEGTKLYCFQERPQDSYSVTVSAGIYEVYQYEDKDYHYYIKYITDEGKTESIKKDKYDMRRLEAEGKFFSKD